MAGSSISITIDDQSLMDALNQVIAKTTNLQPAFADIGEYLDLASWRLWPLMAWVTADNFVQAFP